MTVEHEAHLIQVLLGEFPSGLRKKDIGQFLGISSTVLEKTLCRMQEERRIEYNTSNGHWRLLQQPLPHEHVEAATADSLAERCLLLLAGAEKFAACLLLHEYLQKLIAESVPQGAAVCMELLIYQLLGCPYEKMDDSSIRKYLELILSVQSDAFSLGMRVRLAQSLSSVAYAAAKKLGDQRTQALLNIMDGCLRQHSGKDDPKGLDKLLDDGLAAISALGDDDIEKQIKHFLSFLYYEKGDFRACYAAFDAAQSHLQIMSCQYFNKLYPIYLAPAAHRIGQYAQSIGICTGAIREAKRNKDKYRELWLTAILAVQFLQIGLNEQGLSVLSDILPCADIESSPKLHLWIWRALALYYMNSGKIAMSHRLMNECMQSRMQQGIGRFAYTSSWILEMLEAYEKQGLPSLPGYEVDKEIERVLTRQNKHLHGTAFKIKAQRLPKTDTEGRMTLLQCSRDAFLECGNRREAARSALLLAQQYLHLGKVAEAQALKASARADLVATTLRPASSMPQLTPWQGSVYATTAQDSLERCFSLIGKIDLKISAEAYASALLNTVQRELGAECAAICRLLHDGRCEFIAGSNTAAKEYDRWHFTECMRDLSVPGAQPWALVPSRDNIFLCLHLPRIHGDALFLLLESSYVAGAFVCMSSAHMNALISVMERELNNLSRLQDQQQEARAKHSIEFMLPESDRIEYDDSPGCQRILEQASYAAQSDAPILILGETGVGKEVLARQIHKLSGRPGMFVPVHPASTPENLFESEFFGYEKGAFTGAHKQKRGFFELADKGTFFIDELAEIPMSFQVKLLRVLQDHTFSRVGGIRYIKSDFRLVTATNKNLWAEVQEGRFREDLYYRVSVIPIKVPPLRERQDDIPRLLTLFIHQFSTRYGRKLPPLSPELIEQCKRYSWPGNIREMRNIVERAVILNAGGPLNLFLSEHEESSSVGSRNDCGALYADLPTLEELTVRYIRYVLEKTQGRVIGPDGAESILGVKRSTLYAKLHKYGLK